MPTSARRTAPLVTDAGRRGRRPLRNPIGKQCVGVGLPDDPFYRTPCKTPCHCETSDRCHWLWQSVLLGLFTGALRIPTTSLRTGLGMTREFLQLLSPASAIRFPVPLAPLPKGGWHGEAVTGGFFPVRIYRKRAAFTPQKSLHQPSVGPRQIVKQVQHFLIEKALLGRASRGIF